MTDAHFGHAGRTANTSDFNALNFLIDQRLSQVRTAVPVKIIAVHGGGVGAPPAVDVQPLVNQRTGRNEKEDHGTIYGIPCSRAQGGGNAVINDPKVGDVGHMLVSDRDISALKANKGKQSNPGSARSHSLSDGVYHGAILNEGTPSQYVHFTDDGVTIHCKNGNAITMGPSGINLNGVIIDSSGKITAPSDVIAGSISLQNHTHGGIVVGSANTLGPN